MPTLLEILLIVAVLAVISLIVISPLLWILYRIRRSRNAVAESLALVAEVATREPSTERLETWPPELRSRVPLLVRGEPRFLGNMIVCPLIPERMMELLGIPESERDAVPANGISREQLADGPMCELLESLRGKLPPGPADRDAFNRNLIERLAAAYEKIGQANRVGVLRSWAKSKGFA